MLGIKLTKVCATCNREKPLSEFALKKGTKWYYPNCNSCWSMLLNQYRERKKQKRLEKQRAYDQKHKLEKVATAKAWRAENIEKWREYSRDYIHNRRERDVVFALHDRISTALYSQLKKNKNYKGVFDILGYSAEELKAHLESQFTGGMSWENMGEWHIDHIIPKSFFVFAGTNDTEFRMCWRLENLQPLWAKDNLQKSNNIQKKAG